MVRHYVDICFHQSDHNQTPPEIFKNKPAKLFELMILILFLIAHFWDWEMFWVLKNIGQF